MKTILSFIAMLICGFTLLFNVSDLSPDPWGDEVMKVSILLILVAVFSIGFGFNLGRDKKSRNIQESEADAGIRDQVVHWHGHDRELDRQAGHRV